MVRRNGRALRVAGFYRGLNPFALTTEQLLALDAGIPRLRAQDVLDQARNGGVRLSPKGWYEATLAAGGTRDEAEEAHNRAVSEAMRRNESPGEVM